MNIKEKSYIRSKAMCHRGQVASRGQDLKCAKCFEAAARRIAGRALKSHSCHIRANNAS